MRAFRKKALGGEDEIKDYLNKLEGKLKERFKEFKENNGTNWMV